MRHRTAPSSRAQRTSTLFHEQSPIENRLIKFERQFSYGTCRQMCSIHRLWGLRARAPTPDAHTLAVHGRVRHTCVYSVNDESDTYNGTHAETKKRPCSSAVEAMHDLNHESCVGIWCMLGARKKSWTNHPWRSLKKKVTRRARNPS